MDHGLLNLPLAKRGNIDSQIDAYKATQAATKKAAAKASATTLKADRAAAKARINAMSLERFAELGKPHGKTAAQIKAVFLSAAHWNPMQVLTMKEPVAA